SRAWGYSIGCSDAEGVVPKTHAAEPTATIGDVSQCGLGVADERVSWEVDSSRRSSVAGTAEELRVEPGRVWVGGRGLSVSGRLTDRGKLPRSHELREVEARHVRLDHHVRRLNAERVQAVVLDQQAAQERLHDGRLLPGQRRPVRRDVAELLLHPGRHADGDH